MFKQVSIVLVAATLTIAAIVLPGCSTVSANDVITPDQLKFTSDSALYQSHAATSGMPWPSNGLSGWRNGREYRSALVREAISRRGASEEDAALVNAGELRVGMDRDLAWWSWGPPHRIERERVQGDQVERWWWHAVDDLPEIRERRATMINGRVLYFTVDQYRGRLLR